ncbi:MAG: type II secretion system protein [Candidatus Omnitrophica bacterium]|nr:type II secretion system protein [Candidatus Omnitrophota bacterium]
MNLARRAMTLIELMVAIILLSVLAIGFASIAVFSHMQMVTSDRRAKAQNEAAFVLDHMNKEIPRAIGNFANSIAAVGSVNRVVDVSQIGGDNAISVFIDWPEDPVTTGAAANTPNGRRDDKDRWIAYRFNQAAHAVWYCPRCNGVADILNSNGSAVCASCNPAWGSLDVNTLSNRIFAFTATLTDFDPGVAVENGNCLDINVTARWIPGQDASTDNPEVTLRSRIKMPSVSVN